MRIAHIGVWVPDVDAAAAFWEEHFGCTTGEVYESRRRAGFRSRFVKFPEGRGEIELMSGPWIAERAPEEQMGWAHVALGLGSDAAVDAAAVRFRTSGMLLEGPRRTGDGYYEAVVRAPDGTLIELTT